MIGGLDPQVLLRLSAQRALLGAVSPALRAVACEAAGHVVRVRFVFHGEIDEGDEDAARIAATEIIADFPSPWTIQDEVVRLDHPADLGPCALAEWVFLRREPNVR